MMQSGRSISCVARRNIRASLNLVFRWSWLMMSEGGCKAARAHHPPLDAAQVSVMQAAIRLAVAAEDIRHFQASRHRAAGSGWRHDLQRQPVERALGPPDELVRDPRIARRA
jgi:hypothetical protein